ncbi:hypothetical protein ACFFRR_006885 [Megaselia abdita]
MDNASARTKEEEVIFLQKLDQNNKVVGNKVFNKDTQCGYLCFQDLGVFKRFTNIRSFVFLYGIVGCVITMTYSYFNGTLTTIEKRFKIPSRNMGLIYVGADVTNVIASWFISYYGGKGHRPRIIGIGLISVIIQCILMLQGHLIYGPGEDALSLTEEYKNGTISQENDNKLLCHLNGDTASCVEEVSPWIPQILFFAAQSIAGFGDTVYWVLGPSYMDDNAPKSQAPLLISISTFARLLGPALGYSLASWCLKFYIAPNLTPVITIDDPRWLGAWWIGCIVIGASLIIPSLILSCFPREMPKTVYRKLTSSKDTTHEKASFEDMKKLLKRLLTNKIYIYTTCASVAYIFGYMPFWVFTPKFIETQYKQSSDVANLVTGAVAIVFAALGVLISGGILSRYKPKSKYITGWNVLVGILTTLGITSYIFIGCSDVDNSMTLDTSICISGCQCDYVQYTPICGQDNVNYISPCHAGCLGSEILEGNTIYTNCSCIASGGGTMNGFAVEGTCKTDCYRPFLLFVIVMCTLKFLTFAGRASNFLVSVRCVEEKDKSASLGLSNVFLCLFAFIPAPIVFGWIFDHFCIVWGKTCSSNGNCWLYDSKNLRIWFCGVSATFIGISCIFDILLFKNSDKIKCFDEEDIEKVESKN